MLNLVETIIDNEELQEALRRATAHAFESVKKILASNPQLMEMAREVKEAKERVLSHLDHYISMTVKKLEERKALVYLASSAAEARGIIGDIVGSGKTIVLSKSMSAEEIGLRRFLESRGNRVYETDLGQFLVQLEEGKPMHVTAPAVHMTKEKIAELVAEKLGANLSRQSSPEEIVAVVRRFLRKQFVNADIGISGANAIAADTGSIVILENEGNIRLVTGLPEKHIVVAGVEKIVPNLILAVKTAIVQAAFAGLYPPTYINIISGPSSTGDIEHKRVYGAHGPRELHVILLDNGRRKALSDERLREILRCVRCGRCLFECPVWGHLANHWGGNTYGGPMGILWTAVVEDKREAYPLTLLCLQCKRCSQVCPMSIPLAELIHDLRKEYVTKAYT
ncbi:MAG: lactate utilization protein [Hyperthermus sp.]|nr:MAG: lactate utilization protein [Hyperthermus sp.]